MHQIFKDIFMDIQSKTSWLFFGMLLLTLSSCLTSNSFQKQVPIEDAAWSRAQKPEFEFEIKDTTAIYEPQLLIRHDDNYPFSNIWVRIYIQLPNDTQISDSFQAEIPLADPEGNWLGAAQSVNWTHRVRVNSRKFDEFKKAGRYTVRVAQIMREDPLQGVLNVGWRLDKK